MTNLIQQRRYLILGQLGKKELATFHQIPIFAAVEYASNCNTLDDGCLLLYL